MNSKEIFFKNEYVNILSRLKGDEVPAFGKLSAQGMVEHMTDSIGIAWGRVKEPMQTKPELLEKMKNFAISDKEFKPNTPNSIIGDRVLPLRKKNMQEALQELQSEIDSFVEYYHKNPGAIVTNPFFGDMNYDEWLHLLHKHAIHHIKQFHLA